MNVWLIESRGAAGVPVADPAARLVDCIGEPDFGTRALAELNRVVQAGIWSCYRLRRGAAPTMIASGGLGRTDVGPSCWNAYVGDGLYRRDDSLTRSRELAEGPLVALARWRAEELPADHRQAIYERHGLRERLSLVAPEPGGDVVAVNFYRCTGEPGFAADDAARLGPLAAALLAVVRKHDALCVAASAPAGGPGADLRAALQRRCPALTARELEVCEGMLRGWTFDGIAAQIGVSPLTVKTYRNRAFRRLGLQHRSQLFALLMNEAVFDPH
ncbi:MAG: helix-turn-helix transcriptional regulator [Piscinibacter sp.]